MWEIDWQQIETPFGLAFVKGAEIHFAPNREQKRPFTRRAFQEVFGPIIEQHGYCATRVPHGMDDTFTRRIGFEETWRDDQYTYYMMDAVPFSRKDKRCQQQQ